MLRTVATRELSFEFFSEYAKTAFRKLDKSSTRVEFIVAFSERAILSGSDHVYYDPYLLVQLVSGGQGTCFMDPEDLQLTDLDNIPGKLALDLLPYVPTYIGVALLDALYYHLNDIEKVKPKAVLEFQGLAYEKSIARASKIVEMAGITSSSRVLLIGAIMDIIHAILHKGARLQVADFALAGTEFEGVQIEYDAEPLIESVDTVIMTGNTLKTDTIGKLLDICESLSKQVLVYAMTGANIAPHYLNHGVAVVTSEIFPYYWYAQTPSYMKIYTSSDRSVGTLSVVGQQLNSPQR